MKRSEMVQLIGYYFNDHDFENEEEAGEAVLEMIERMGMLPPTNTCRVISDGNGGFKHSPTAREWDDEEV